MTDVCNYADDTTFHACELDIKSLITRLEHDAILTIEWFESNYKCNRKINVISYFQGTNMKRCLLI